MIFRDRENHYFLTWRLRVINNGYCIHRKNDFAEVESKNLAKYRSENNLTGPSKYRKHDEQYCKKF